MEIIRITQLDLWRLVDLVKTTFPQDFQFNGAFDENKCHEMFMGAIEDPNEFVFIVKRDEEVIAFAYYINKPPSNGTIILEMIGVLPELQGQGVGNKLLGQANVMVTELVRKVGIEVRTIHLTTNITNHRARKVYENCGFRVIAELPRFTGQPDNIELFMLCDLNDTSGLSELWT